MTIDGTGFNVDYWSRFTLEEFIAEGVRDNVLSGDADKLKIAYELIRLQGQAGEIRYNAGNEGGNS